MRTQKSLKNMFFGIVLQLVMAGIGIVNRTVMIRYIGIQALSLNGLFTEVLAMLSLAELGVGSAITYSLYEPLATKNYNQISRLMNLFQKAYRFVAISILGIGLFLTLFIQYIVNSVSYPISYIRFIFILFVIQTASSYLFSYKTALITADQKQYVISIITTVSKLIMAGIQIAVIVFTKDYVLYLINSIAFTFGTNIVIAIVANRLYPFLDKREKLDKKEQQEIFSNIKNVFVSKISGTITNSTDNTLISVLVSTIAVGYYSNYATIINIIKGFLTQFTNAITASFGNLLVSESKEYCDTVLRRVTYITFVFGGVCATGLDCALSNLIELWLGKEFLLDDFTVFICILCLYVNIIRTPLWTVLEISGLFKENRNTGVLGSVINLIVSVVLGRKWGMAGIFLGTICTYVVQGILKIYYLYTRKLGLSALPFYRDTGMYIFIVLVQCLVAKFICVHVKMDNMVLTFIVNCCVAVAVSVLFDILPFVMTERFRYCLKLGKSFISKKSAKREIMNNEN